MAYFRALLIAVALFFFFVVGAPLQWFLARRRPKLAGRIPLMFCRTLLRLLRVRVDVSGTWIRQGPLLLVVNHVSWLDVLVLASMTPFCFLAKREVASWPVLSAFARVQGTVFVDRARKRGIPQANRLMADRMLEGRIVLLFPEGTTYDGTAPGPFYSSHFAAARDLLRGTTHTMVTVQPAALAYSSGVAAWIGDEALLPHLWRVLCGPPIGCLVSFSAPIVYGRSSDRKIVARIARAAIVDLLAAKATAAFRPAWSANEATESAAEDSAVVPGF